MQRSSEPAEGPSLDEYPYYWRVRKFLPYRHGQPCKVTARARRLNQIRVEFPDGESYVTLGWFVRKRRNA